MNKISWSLPEYEEKETSIDWFWALGIVIVASATTSIIYKNYFFAILLIIGGALMGYFSTKKPEVINYEINEQGVLIHKRLYPFEKIKAFFVRKGEKPMFFVKSERIFMPVLILPIESSLADKISEVMQSKNVPEELMQEHPSETIMEFLGF